MISHLRGREWIWFPHNIPNSFNSNLTISLYLDIFGFKIRSQQISAQNFWAQHWEVLMQTNVIQSNTAKHRSLATKKSISELSLVSVPPGFLHGRLKNLGLSVNLAQWVAIGHAMSGRKFVNRRQNWKDWLIFLRALTTVTICNHLHVKNIRPWGKMFLKVIVLRPIPFIFFMLAAYFKHVQVQGIGTNIFLSLFCLSFLFISWNQTDT